MEEVMRNKFQKIISSLDFDDFGIDEMITEQKELHAKLEEIVATITITNNQLQRNLVA